MACARHLLLLLSLLPMSMAWKPKSLFLFNKRTGEACSDHSECQSRCCVPNSPNPQAFCAAKTLFLQCVPWRKLLRHQQRQLADVLQAAGHLPAVHALAQARRRPLRPPPGVPEPVLHRAQRGQLSPLRPPERPPGAVPALVTGELGSRVHAALSRL
ncbi:leucine-rich colipase-like protein 1 isoform X3 [Mustela lutreola]|uniref:leucine-rich colipase-like protein 1 isoform X3 n=1 Tax=Mustela lutreola TaxID=9666 RepID=UPI00279752F6|nr:leucine-rich colipase-like protein 1 isoform X3 [Mustela lutreola]